jgi:hypothetical protein
MKTEPTFRAEICMAGDLATAEQVCREFCWQTGFCVTVMPTTFIYTAGEERGFIVRAVNYPRFPAEPVEIRQKVERLAAFLAERCCQRSYLVVGDDQTTWYTLDPPGARS